MCRDRSSLSPSAGADPGRDADYGGERKAGPARGPAKPATERASLAAAYEASNYFVHDGEDRIALNVGHPDTAIDRLLARHRASCGVFMTAWNPRSERFSPAENRAAAARLEAELGGARYRYLPCISGDGRWREEGVFTFDLPQALAVEIAETFGQNAIVMVARGAAPRLVFTGLMRA